MFTDLGPMELLTIIVIALLVIGPNKLPKVIQDVTRTIRKIREFSESAKQDIRSELGPEFKDFEFEDLNPRTFVRKQLASANDELGLKEIRKSFDLRKEMSEVTDAVSGLDHDVSAPAPSSSSASPSSSPSSLSPVGHGSMDRVDFDKKPETSGKEELPLFDADAT
ncbi:sec-independent translocase [Streptomyces pseudovenezuelae]|uniref:sec-independent translocase n=1 Tax=Streptomyces pseudovenezuelae TaxID=67350 RepID=UPI0034A28470